MILIPPELWENRPHSPPTGNKILNSKDHSYNKWAQVRLHQNPYLKTEKFKREPIPISTIENESSKPSFETKP